MKKKLEKIEEEIQWWLFAIFFIILISPVILLEKLGCINIWDNEHNEHD